MNPKILTPIWYASTGATIGLIIASAYQQTIGIQENQTGIITGLVYLEMKERGWLI